MDHIYWLQYSKLFSDLDTEDLKELASFTQERTYQPKQLIFSQSDDSDGLYIILDGLINIFQSDSTGHTFTLTTLGKQDTFGEISLLDGMPRSASAEAIKTSHLLFLRRSGFLNVLSRHNALLHAVLRGFAGRLRKQSDYSSRRTFHTLRHRLAHLLVSSYEANNQSSELIVKQDLLASILGVSRETINRSLSRLSDEGAIVTGRNKININIMLLRSIIDT